MTWPWTVLIAACFGVVAVAGFMCGYRFGQERGRVLGWQAGWQARRFAYDRDAEVTKVVVARRVS